MNIDTTHFNKHSAQKGKTKENCESIRRQCETYKERYKNGLIKNWNVGKTKDTHDGLKKLSNSVSKTISEKVKNGTWHYSFSKVRTHVYESKTNGVIKVMGTWELKLAKYFDDNNINWKPNKTKFYYEYHGLKSGKGYYTPDFYLIDTDEYVEVKGYETDKDRAKWKWFPHKLIVLKREQLTNFPYNLTLSDKK